MIRKMRSARTAVVTGASAGIGEATARRLAAEGFAVVVGARRVERLERLAGEIGAEARRLDVTDEASVERFAAGLDRVDLLVNNAGFGVGLDPVVDTPVDDWAAMYDTNVVGVVRVTRALVGAIEASGDGHVVNVGSIAGFEAYAGGGGYTASKHALRALTKTLRLELLGRPIRVTEICPGMVETEFSRIRFRGDEARAAAVYQGMTPLTPDDIADCIAWAATRPSHVNIDEIVVRPRDQATAYAVHREE